MASEIHCLRELAGVSEVQDDLVPCRLLPFCIAAPSWPLGRHPDMPRETNAKMPLPLCCISTNEISLPILSCAHRLTGV